MEKPKTKKLLGGVTMGKAHKLALFGLLVLVLSLVASVALAASPDAATTATTVIDPTTGVSRWTYKDAADNAAKTEGGYAAFTTGTIYTINPHGGYDSTTNKCKVCHAVHRAEGAYFLLRADTQDDACSYCHIGGSAHSRKIVYDLAGTIYTPNGHTIGASSIIPDSSVYQWLEELELKTVDENGDEVTATVEVRRYYERRNKMFRFARHHGQSATADAATRGGYGRIGPLALRCMNCHQPHNAVDMIWMPQQGFPLGTYGTSFVVYQRLFANTGYKLLRSSPSGSVQPRPDKTLDLDGAPGNEANLFRVQVDRLAVWPLDGDTGIARSWIIRVPEDPTIGPNNTGKVGTDYKTIWTRWPETADHEFHGAEYRDPSNVNAMTLSVWCADCHNLNIGYWSEPEGAADPMLFGFKSHSERTHPAPYTGAYNGPAQCYSCHRNDRPAASGYRDYYGTTYTASAYTANAGDGLPRGIYRTASASCEQCHFGTASYYDTMRAREVAGQFAYYDFPHSGGSDYIKLLGNWTVNVSYTTTGSPHYVNSITNSIGTVTITSSNLDAVCKRCHPGIGISH
jgi:hypothetical protein